MVLNQTRTLQIDDQPRNEPTPEPAGDIGHVVASSNAVHGIVYHLQAFNNARTLLTAFRSKRRKRRDAICIRMTNTPNTKLSLWNIQLFIVATRLPRGRLGVNKVHYRSLVWQHGRDEAVSVTEREGDFESLKQLEVLLKEGAGKSTIITEDKGHIGLLQDTIMNERILFWYGDDLSQHVCQPDWVNEVQVVESAKVVVVVKQNAIVMEKLSSYRGGREGEGKESFVNLM